MTKFSIFVLYDFFSKGNVQQRVQINNQEEVKDWSIPHCQREIN